VQTLWQDLRYGLRMLRNSPGFAIVVVLTLALGIGATSAVFSVVDRVLFRGLPYPEDDRLVSFGWKTPLMASEVMAAKDYVEWRKSAWPSAQMGSMTPEEIYCEFTEQNPVQMACARVDSRFLPTLGIQPILGRNFTADDCLLHAPRLALLSYGVWRSRYGGDPKIVGRSVSLDGKPVKSSACFPRNSKCPRLHALTC
jgi:putative ABC transport system permease protein